jgi:phage shock protein E
MVISRLSILTLITFLLFFGSFNASAEAVWIDVRSKLEHMLDNIEGDLQISHSNIVEEVSQIFPDKSQEIILYCAAGVRAEKARKLLVKAGYLSVTNAGSIDDARIKRDLLP